MNTFVRVPHAVLLAAVTIAGMSATPIADPANDFLTTFTGLHTDDLDVISAQVSFDGANFTFTSQENGPIGTNPNAIFVWGVDRGTHTAGFGAFRPGVLFDAVVLLRPDLTGTVVDLGPNPAAPANLASGSVTISGNTIQAVVPSLLLPSRGVQPAQYGVNLWPRTGLTDVSQIADFAPDNSDAAVTITPEPSTVSLGLALLGLAFLRYRARS